MLASQTARYLRAARQVNAGGDARTVAEGEHLDAETLGRWVRYVNDPAKDHPYLKDWADERKFDPEKFRQQVLAVLRERKTVDEENLIRKAEAKRKGPKASPETVSLKTESFYLWRDLFFSDFYGNQFKQEDDGLLYYGPNRGFYESDGAVERFLHGDWQRHLEHLRAELVELKKALPAQYAFLHTIKDSEKLRTARVHIGGSAENLGEEVPRRFLTILAPGAEPAPFTKGSGRLELAEAIASPSNPLTARVMANRIWHGHFGAGLVRTPSDFGFMGDRPSHPELLDYLASRLVESGWSVKALHREIVLSAAYRASSQRIAANDEIDPENRLLWRAPVRRMDAESLRDSLLAVSGDLDLAVAGGPPQPLTDAANLRRTVYGSVSRRKLDPSLALFDFPNPNISSEKRAVTITPVQQLYFLNGDFMMERAARLSARVTGAPAERVRGLYRLVFGREPDARELRLGLDFLGDGRGPLYAQALLDSNEFVFVK